MTAEGNLYNPALFSGLSPNAAEIAIEFGEIATIYKYPTLSSARGHMFKLFHHVFLKDEYKDQRDILASANNFEEICQMAKVIHERLAPLSSKLTKTLYTAPRIKGRVKNRTGDQF